MPIAAAEQNRAALAIANAGDDWLALCSADPTAAGNDQIADAGRVALNLGREAGDPDGEVKNLAQVDFAPTGIVENASHFAVMDAAAAGNVRAWGRIVDGQGDPASLTMGSADDILRVPKGAIRIRIPSGA